MVALEQKSSSTWLRRRVGDRNPAIQPIIDVLEPLGDVRARSMFGGFGIFCGSLMFGWIENKLLYLKVDELTVESYQQRGMEPYMPKKRSVKYSISYYRVPAEVYENPEALLHWGREAQQAAERSDKKRDKYRLVLQRPDKKNR